MGDRLRDMSEADKRWLQSQTEKAVEAKLPGELVQALEWFLTKELNDEITRVANMDRRDRSPLDIERMEATTDILCKLLKR